VAVTPLESIDRDYDRLLKFLRRLSFRLRLLDFVDLILLIVSTLLLILLGSLFAFGLKDIFFYLPYAYSAGTFLSMGVLIAIVVWRISRKASFDDVARGLEGKYPTLRDDVTNSIQLFGEAAHSEKGSRLSRGLIAAQLRKTVKEVDAIKVDEVVSLRAAFVRLSCSCPFLQRGQSSWVSIPSS
jgi:hypothetical protein